MIVEAVCTYDSLLSSPSKISTGCVRFERNKTYRLDLSDPEQRKLLTLSWQFGTQKRWCFEFDRSANSNPAEGVWFCKDCGAYFDKFTDLGTHCTSTHQSKAKKQVAEAQAREEEEGIDHPADEEVVVEKRGKGKGRTYTCKQCGEVMPHPYAMRIHNQEKHQPVVAEG